MMRQGNRIVQGRVMKRIAVIGAGITGLTAGRGLFELGWDVQVWDKGRRPGGRVATRRQDEQRYDHGAQYFTIRDPRFQTATSAWLHNGSVAEWRGRIVRWEAGETQETAPQPRFVGVPGMSAMAANLAEGLQIHSERRITHLEHTPQGWKLYEETSLCGEGFDAVLVTVPAPQVPGLLVEHPFSQHAQAVTMNPCWAVMVTLSQRAQLDWDGAFVHGSSLGWIARNSSKPGRKPTPDAWVLHANADWSREHLESSPESVCSALFTAFREIVGSVQPTNIMAHRWRYSLGCIEPKEAAWHDPTIQLVVAGDWISGGRVEGAFLAGLSVVEALSTP
jgi:renalase